MQLSSLRVDWTSPRTWFVTARLLEVAAVWWPSSGWLAELAGLPVDQPDVRRQPASRVPGTALPRPGGACSPCTASGSARPRSADSSPASCSSAIVALLHFAQPVSHAALLRWEVLAIWVVAVLLNRRSSLAAVVGWSRATPTRPRTARSPSTPGPGFTERCCSGVDRPGAVPAAAVGVGALVAAAARGVRRAGGRAGRAVREPRRWRPAPAPDANVDDLTLDGVELIEPVERLHPRDVRRRRLDGQRLRRLLPTLLGTASGGFRGLRARSSTCWSARCSAAPASILVRTDRIFTERLLRSGLSRAVAAVRFVRLAV